MNNLKILQVIDLYAMVLLLYISTHSVIGIESSVKQTDKAESSANSANRRLRDTFSREASRRQRKRSLDGYFGSAVYFDGHHQHIRLRSLTKRGRISVPNEKFTVQFWAKPEGGQNTYTPIVEIYDECENHVSSTGWIVGIGTRSYERRDARFVFSMLTDDAESTSHLFAHKQYDPNVWTNVAATYDGEVMSLYINGAKISLTKEQKGIIFPKSKSKCKLLFLGGNFLTARLYRGKIDEFRLWNRKLLHSEITSNMYLRSSDLKIDRNLLIADSFDEKDLMQWRVKPSMLPEVVKSDIPLFDHHVRFEAPHCGHTVCDDPAAVMSFVKNPDLRNEKTLRLRLVNLMDDDGSNPLISDKQVFEQMRIVSKIYNTYNISFEIENFMVKNSTLRNRVIMFECVPYKIGNRICDKECGHSTTGNDGGDCDEVHSECLQELLGNGVCDSECNKEYHRYDDGDCCLPGDDVNKTCIDPNNPLRAYINVEDLKVQLKIDGSSSINIFFITASWYREQFRGLATFPWEKNVYTSVGGNIFHVDSFGNPDKMESLVHEIGHNLGLWHVHRGISEVPCDDPCFESHPSMILGDLCSDTKPTPRNRYCADPRPDQIAEEDTCDIYRFKDTPFHNYMSYADDACTNTFTPQQVARMHCYLDLVYQPMREMKYPAPIPLAPKVVEASNNTVKMVWIEPLGTDTSCDADGAFYQYADIATSSHSGVRWSPHEATGFPDGKKCFPSPQAWMPNIDYLPACEDKSCWLELGFAVAVTPRRVNIWINDVEDDTAILVELLASDGTTKYSRTVAAYCDMETTLMVDVQTKIDKIRIFTTDSYVAIDAVQLVSKHSFPTCTKRKTIKYRVYREPAFDDGYTVSAIPEFTDSTVIDGETYTYRVQAVLESRGSVMSPELIYTHGKEFCGDGVTNGNEECDDRNVFDGDGCSVDCKVEEGFRCKGAPSLCYIHENDGECEDFEIGQNIPDCGFHTPDGYMDQWAMTAIASPDYETADCPAGAITGKPDAYQKCEAYPVGTHMWRPCGVYHDMLGYFWIETTIHKPVIAVSVIIHLASDGITRINTLQKFLHVDLVTTDNKYISLEPQGIPIDCKSSPLLVSVHQNLNDEFVLTKAFERLNGNLCGKGMSYSKSYFVIVKKKRTIFCEEETLCIYLNYRDRIGVRVSFTFSSISIAGIRVRSSPYINPVEIKSCESDELYNPRSGLCVKNTCSKSMCGPYPVKRGVADCSGFEEGDKCVITCDEGYYIDSHDNSALCTDGHWMTSFPLQCLPVDCGRPSITRATVACSDGTTFMQECFFKCDKPAILVGQDTSIRCRSDGSWSSPEGSCEIKCPSLDPDMVRYGSLKTDSCATGLQEVGQECRVRCEEGYHVQGERNKKRILRVVCEDDGEWDGPVCIPNQCEPLPVMFKGAYSCTDGFFSGSICTMGCSGDLAVFQSVRCDIDGNWDGTLSVCPSDNTKTCDIIKKKGDVIFDCVDTFAGGKCSVSCEEAGFQPVQNVPSRDLDVMFNFIDVDKIECTVMQKWEPPPEMIHCVKPCLSEESIGNGFCEAENNREFCDWDGGDCCKSTVQDGHVVTFPEYCPIDCKCRDPNAIENRRKARRKRKHHVGK